MSLRTTKVFVDSRYALSGDASSFQYEIAHGGVELRMNAKCWVSEFTAVASWDSLDASNSILYVEEQATTQRAIQLPTGPHDIESLRAAIETALNGAGKDVGMGTYTVTRVSSGTGGGTFRLYKVACDAGTFTLPSDATVVSDFAVVDPLSTNSALSFPTGNTPAGEHTSTFVDLRRVHSVFVHSPSFGNYNCVDPMGRRTCIAKIPVDAAYGGLVQWQSSGSQHDHIDCGVRSLHIMRFELRDAAGRLLDLQGTHWSMTLLFDN